MSRPPDGTCGFDRKARDFVENKKLKQISEVLQEIESTACEILQLYPVRRAALFGSAARRNASEINDVDILVEFLPSFQGLDFFGLRVDLEEALGRPVDLITWNALSKAKPGIRNNIEGEARLIYES